MPLRSLGAITLPGVAASQVVFGGLANPDECGCTDYFSREKLRIHGKKGHALRDRHASWAQSVRHLVDEVFPELQEGASDPGLFQSPGGWVKVLVTA